MFLWKGRTANKLRQVIFIHLVCSRWIMAFSNSTSKNVPHVCTRFNLTRLSQEQTHTGVLAAHSQLETVCTCIIRKHRNVSVDFTAHTVSWTRGLTAWRDSWNFSSAGPFRRIVGNNWKTASLSLSLFCSRFILWS